MINGAFPKDSTLFLVKVQNRLVQDLRNVICVWVEPGSQ